MKLGWKIFLLCVGIYVVSLTITGFVVSENTYTSLLKNEVEGTVEEESNLHSTLAVYLLNNQRIAQEEIELKNYSKSMVDMINSDRNYLEIFDENLNLLATNAPKAWFFSRKELDVALEGQKNFVLRRDEDELYLFVSNVLEIGEEKIVLSLIKDITHVDHYRREQYLLFMRTGLMGLIFVALITWALSILLLKPFRELSSTAENIASGNYHVRAEVNRTDEVGLLAEQFNIMAGEIEQKMGELKEEGQQQQRFIDNLTHELRTPLTSIIGYAEYLLKAEYDSKTFNKGLSYIHSEGNRMLKLAKTLMDMILVRERSLQLEEEHVMSLLVMIQNIMKVKAEKKGVILKVQGENLKISIDKELFKVAIINLVDNAINASQEGQTVTMGVEKTPQKISLYIKDEGKGMAEWELNRVIQPFYRVDKSRSRKDGGIGLGLAICYQIVKEHGAIFEIESEIGKGTKIKVDFPQRVYKNFTS
ncbi:integral membrane sensor signal transduction histidine kinase [Alkaliphilus metalliredigens QYMF]|uniref:histidine kinase n=1 Tax=Alkaliphilus metalliredigens (strain QYMF) TaxID=293826 RepID=A6TK03_ALKMQ|nr:HAMP domain-containing sensor histidine kinase [Alkaliphilus metalliredigens]ABR46521.1 integral membrane sensor signal transduction histidine kinase [Alkaliphilus metalliredigens QYMF]